MMSNKKNNESLVSFKPINKNKNSQLLIESSFDNDNNIEEPEKPLTGYNHRRQFNEGSVIHNATMSANKLKNMLEVMDL